MAQAKEPMLVDFDFNVIRRPNGTLQIDLYDDGKLITSVVAFEAMDSRQFLSSDKVRGYVRIRLIKT